MARLFRGFTLLFAALLSWACESKGQCSIIGVNEPGPPPPPMYGTWEGREAPRVLSEPSPFWRFELENNPGPDLSYVGTFATDRLIVEEWVYPDTLRGPVSALECYHQQEIVFEFELRYPRSSNPVDDGDYYVHPCTISGRLQGNWRIDGLLACHRPTGLTTRRAIYLIRDEKSF